MSHTPTYALKAAEKEALNAWRINKTAENYTLFVTAQHTRIMGFAPTNTSTSRLVVSTTAMPVFKTAAPKNNSFERQMGTTPRQATFVNTHTLAMPQFSNGTSNLPKAKRLAKKIMLGSTLLLGLNFSDNLNQIYDKITGKEPVKTYRTHASVFAAAPTYTQPTMASASKTTNKKSKAPLAKNIHTHTATNTTKGILKNFETYYQSFMASPHVAGFDSSPENVMTLYNIIQNESPKQGYAELPTTGGRYDSKKYANNMRGNGGGASGAYQFMASTWIAMGILEKIGKTHKTKPSKAHLVCAELNNQAAANNSPSIYIPLVNKKGNSTGRYYKLQLTSEAKNVSGLEKATDIYTTKAGAKVQDYAASKLMRTNSQYISADIKNDPTECAKAHAKFWYHGPEGAKKSIPYGKWHLFSTQKDQIVEFKSKNTYYADSTIATPTEAPTPFR